MFSLNDKTIKINESNDIFNLLVYICDRCNYDCWYCYNKKPRSNSILNLHVLYDYIQFLKHNINKQFSIELIGGEPSLHPDILQFIEKLTDIQSIYIYTNFSCDINFYKKILEKNKNVKFDITYHHTKDQQLNKKVLKNIYCIQPNNIRGINLMLDKKYLKHIYNIYNNIKYRLKNVDVDIQQIFLNDPDEYVYSKEQLKFYNDSLKNEQNKKFIITNNSSSIKVSHNELYEMFHQNYKHWICNAGKDLLYIHYDGNVYRCDGYFNEKHNPMFNIYVNFLYPNKQTLCQIDKCPFQDEVFKQKIF